MSVLESITLLASKHISTTRVHSDPCNHAEHREFCWSKNSAVHLKKFFFFSSILKANFGLKQPYNLHTHIKCCCGPTADMQWICVNEINYKNFHSIIQQIFTKNLLCAKEYASHWGFEG